MRAIFPTAAQKQICQVLPLDLTLYGSFEQELIFGWGKKKMCPTYCLRNQEKGKEVGREEEEGKSIAIIIWSFIYIYICFHLYIHLFIATYTI